MAGKVRARRHLAYTTLSAALVVSNALVAPSPVFAAPLEGVPAQTDEYGVSAAGAVEVSTPDQLAAAAADSTVTEVTLADDIDVSGLTTLYQPDPSYYPDVKTPVMFTHDVVLDLNGHTVTSDGTGYFSIMAFRGTENAPITVRVIDSAGGGKIAGAHAYSGGGMFSNYADLTIGNVQISDNSAVRGGGVAVMNGTLSIEGAEISGNECYQGGAGQGGGLYAFNSEITFRGGVISRNFADEVGAGVCLSVNARFILDGGAISGNELHGDMRVNKGGGGIGCMSGSAAIVLRSGSITANTVEGGFSGEPAHGGGIWNGRYPSGGSSQITIEGAVDISGNLNRGTSGSESNSDNIFVNISGEETSQPPIAVVGELPVGTKYSIGAGGDTSRKVIAMDGDVTDFFATDDPDQTLTDDGYLRERFDPEITLRSSAISYEPRATFDVEVVSDRTDVSIEVRRDNEDGDILAEAVNANSVPIKIRENRIVPGNGRLYVKATADGVSKEATLDYELLPYTIGAYGDPIIWDGFENRYAGDGKQATATIDPYELMMFDDHDVRIQLSNGDASTAGHYSCTATLVGDDAAYFTFAENVKTERELIIAKAPISVELTPLHDAYTYGDIAEFEVSATSQAGVDGLEATLVLDRDFGGDVELGTASLDSSGTATISVDTSEKALASGVNNLTVTVEGSTAHTSLTLLQRELTVSGVAAQDRVYDGTTKVEMDATNMVLGNLVAADEGAIHVKVKSEGEMENPDAGVAKTVTYQAYIVSGGEQPSASAYYKVSNPLTTSVDIAPASPSLAPDAPTSLALEDGSTAADIDASSWCIGIDGKVLEGDFTWYRDSAHADPVGDDVLVDGTYYWVFEPDSANYRSFEGSISLDVRDAPKAISLAGVTDAQYGDDVPVHVSLENFSSGSHLVEFSVNGISVGSISVDSTGDGEFTLSVKDDRFKVGANVLTAVCEGVTHELEFEVAPRPLSVSGVMAPERVYDGTDEFAIDASGARLDGVLDGDEVSLSVPKSAHASRTDVGDVELSVNVSLTGEDAGFYTIETPVTLASRINPATPTFADGGTVGSESASIEVSAGTTLAELEGGIGLVDIDGKPLAGEFVWSKAATRAKDGAKALVPGESIAPETVVEDGVTYLWTFVPASANYAQLSGSIFTTVSEGAAPNPDPDSGRPGNQDSSDDSSTGRDDAETQTEGDALPQSSDANPTVLGAFLTVLGAVAVAAGFGRRRSNGA